MLSPISTPGFPSVRARQSAATCDSAMETRVASLEAIIASLPSLIAPAIGKAFEKALGDSAMETRVASLEASIASLPSLIATAIDKAFEKGLANALDASLEKFRREMLSRGAGEGISAPLDGDHHGSPAIDPIQLPRSPICAEGAQSHLSEDQLARVEEEDSFNRFLESIKKVAAPTSCLWSGTVADDDDDCVVLDGDPDKPVSVVEDSGSGSDELLVVRETGQVACRDYPHPRHLCAKFPFKTTRHENHCDLCHCYVCDSLAPCVDWSTGGSNFNHCHATDKKESWRILRKKIQYTKNWVNNSSPNIQQPLIQQPSMQLLPGLQPPIQLLPVLQRPIQQQPPLQQPPIQQPQFQQPSPIQQQPSIEIFEIQSTEPVYGLWKPGCLWNLNGLGEEFES